MTGSPGERSKGELFNRAAELFLELIEQPAGDRTALLEAKCGADRELRDRVTSLLAGHAKGPVLEEPPEPLTEPPQSPMPGSEDGRYRLVDRIGEGGMSQVHRAYDITLGRVVALKFLAPHLMHSSDGMKRFEREAKATAALDHPNICPIYDIDLTAPRPFIAMAYLDGQTLDKRLQGGPIEVAAAVDIAIQICRGLACAHAKLIVHRDIKPSNLMITEVTGAGRLVRILDFGIARQSVNSEMTGEGLTIGTISYIAPEQIERSSVDGRADIWALGVVLYRMLAGELPFHGDTTRATLAAIAAMDPRPLTSVRGGIPPALDAIVGKALQKDPDRRYQSAEEFLAALQGFDRYLGQVEQAAAVAKAGADKAREHARLAWAACAGLALILIFVVVFRKGAAPEPAPAPVPFTSFLGAEGDPAISPDGTRIAFTWNGEAQSKEPDIYIQMIGSGPPLHLTDTPYGEFHPVWSPDGKYLAFLRYINYQSSIAVAPALGGAEREIAAAPKNSVFSSLDWSPKANILATDLDGRITTISVDDRSSRTLSSPPPGATDAYPKFDPTGRSLAFLRYHVDAPTEILLIPAGGGAPRVIRKSGNFEYAFCWSADGSELVFAGHPRVDGGRLRAIRVSDGSLVPLRIDVGNAASPDVRGSLLAYTRRIFEVNIWAAGIGTDGGLPGKAPRRLIDSSRRDHSPQFSPDGQSIVFASTRSGTVQIWRSDRLGHNAVQLTFATTSQSVGTPRWSADGRSIAFDQNVANSQPDIYVVDANGGPQRRVTDDPARDILPSWSMDGRWIYFCSNRGGTNNIWKVPSGGGPAIRVTSHGGWEAFESLDGKALYYSEPGGPKTIHRLDLATGQDQPLPQLGDAGARRYWAVAREGIFFVNTLDAANWVQRFDFATRKVTRVQKIGDIINYGPGGLSVSPDGKTLIWGQIDQDDQDIMLVKDFQ